ncbi:hypothetical protein [Streptomyces sp. NPDC001717]|uniref:hypothetical protein n=1 Tax=Streptomyces sp. NPDC001717 TaxID=3364604 RepID=UPI0036B2E6D5
MVQELTPGSVVTVSHSGVLLPLMGVDPARTTMSRAPVPHRMSSIARLVEPGTTAPAPFMV